MRWTLADKLRLLVVKLVFGKKHGVIYNTLFDTSEYPVTIPYLQNIIIACNTFDGTPGRTYDDLDS